MFPISPGPRPSTRRWAGGAKRSRRRSSSRPAASGWSCGAGTNWRGTAGWVEAPSTGFGGIALAHNVRSDAEVDTLLGVVERSGGTVTKPAAVNPIGFYSGAFTDPDGHAWEVAHNPGFPLAEDGTVTLPDFGAQ